MPRRQGRRVRAAQGVVQVPTGHFRARAGTDSETRESGVRRTVAPCQSPGPALCSGPGAPQPRAATNRSRGHGPGQASSCLAPSSSPQAQLSPGRNRAARARTVTRPGHDSAEPQGLSAGPQQMQLAASRETAPCPGPGRPSRRQPPAGAGQRPLRPGPPAVPRRTHPGQVRPPRCPGRPGPEPDFRPVDPARGVGVPRAAHFACEQAIRPPPPQRPPSRGRRGLSRRRRRRQARPHRRRGGGGGRRRRRRGPGPGRGGGCARGPWSGAAGGPTWPRGRMNSHGFREAARIPPRRGRKRCARAEGPPGRAAGSVSRRAPARLAASPHAARPGGGFSARLAART